MKIGLLLRLLDRTVYYISATGTAYNKIFLFACTKYDEVT